MASQDVYHSAYRIPHCDIRLSYPHQVIHCGLAHFCESSSGLDHTYMKPETRRCETRMVLLGWRSSSDLECLLRMHNPLGSTLSMAIKNGGKK